MLQLNWTDTVLHLANENATEMIQYHEVKRKIKFGRANSYFWLSSDEKSLIEPTKIDVDGKCFFLSLFCQEEPSL